MTRLIEQSLTYLGSLFIRLVTRPKLINPQLLLPSKGPKQKIYYVLESDRLSHRLLLKHLLSKQQREISDSQILLADSGGTAPLRETLVDLVQAQQSNPDLNTLIIPVAIFHGRLPGREDSWLNLLYAETWHKAGTLGGALQLLLNGRHTLVKVDEALALSQLVAEQECTEATARKTARVLRTHFVITRQSIIGPDLSHRRNFISLVLNDPKVQKAIDQQAAISGESRHRIERHCLKTLDKIAANFSPVTARVLFPIFNWLWKRLYKRVNVCNSDQVREIAKSHHLIYLPCHRSHMDYLLLSWSLYQQGLVIPHVAAGENLNIPVIGPILKRCGAIFMRRSFKGDHLYACLYKSYLEQMSHRGHPLEYFIEGGRSRTGRLLPAKTGLLSMNIDSYRENRHHPVALIPVWIGYDRLVESGSYQHELTGSAKKKESVSGFVSSLGILKESFGETYLSFGDPILLDQTSDSSLTLENEITNTAQQVMYRINNAACLTKSSILGTTLLAGFQSQSVAELSHKCTSLLDLLNELNVHSGNAPIGMPSEWIEDAATMGQVTLQYNQVLLSETQAQEMSFYRNNIQHLLALPGLYLLIIRRVDKARAQTINKTIRALYPFLQAELFLPWHEDELTPILKKHRETLLSHNLLQSDNDTWSLTSHPLCNTLLLSVEPIILRYYIVLGLLSQYEEISNDDLISTSQKIAKKIHTEYGYNPPEYGDRHVLHAFIKELAYKQQIHSKDGRWQANLDAEETLTQIRKILRPHMVSLIDHQLNSQLN